MFPSLRNSLFALATLASLAGTGLVTPAAAWDRPGRDWSDDRGGWGRDHRQGGWSDDRGGWGRGYRHGWGHHRSPYWGGYERCGIELRRVRVYTPWGPRLRTVEERVCR